MHKHPTETPSFTAPKSQTDKERVLAIPDIKLSHSGYLIFANAKGIDFLRKLSDDRKTSSVGFLISEFPVILVPGCKTTLHLNIGEDAYDIQVTSYRLNSQVGLFISKQRRTVNSGSVSPATIK